MGNYREMTNLQDYVPKPGDPVKVEGVIIKLVVVGVNAPARTALVASASAPAVSYSVPWSKLTRLPS